MSNEPNTTDIQLIRETLIVECHELVEGSPAIDALDRLVAERDALKAGIARKHAALESAIRALKKIRARVGNYMEFRLYLRACEAIFTCQKALEDAK